ncbi:acetate--CoA ligase [Agromyces protaetiae]|uniref:Acetate--CoA ligase n=1 Tax=Agromyces protaetiae TaxID=2509455 RepID=A0A4P6FG24_9MICO|nr:acetate--CoA ligase [Agromyces protaetiae]QAY72767.1 acetate--CoA ligase [Agromyces protaetiae]
MSAPITALGGDAAVYPPDPAFAAQANVDAAFVEAAAADPLAFWARESSLLEWAEPWQTLHTWEPTDASGTTIPKATWFAGGQLNAAVNAVDRHVSAGHGDRVAFHFEGERGDRRSITYAELEREVSRAANALAALGVEQGDRVVLYLPVLIETVVATLAVARLGAVHSLVFGGFSAEALRFRVEDTRAKVVVTSDGQFRRGTAVGVKAAVDEAVAGLDHVEHVVVVRRTGDETPDTPFTTGRDVWWHEALAEASDRHDAQAFDAETPLFIIYTSGTTGKPKGLVHTTGGYLTHVASTFRSVFDAKPDSDVYWCTADLAWVTAHSYVLYGPLLHGMTSVIYEGTPNTPHAGRHFEIIERYGVTTYYTAPTLVRSFMSWFPEGLAAGAVNVPSGGWDFSTIRLLGSVGEAINPAAWEWFRAEIGVGRAPIVDTWWQSETGAAVMAPLPGLSTLKPGSSLHALPGLTTRVVDDHGDDVARGQGGYLVIDGTWPGMARTVWGNPERYRDSYWARFAHRGFFFSGDGARLDADGDVWLLGRVDDVINVSGHRLSTIEIESALVAHPSVAEAGVVGVSDDTTGEAIAAFVVTADGAEHRADVSPEALARAAALRAHVATAIGPIAKPRDLVFVKELPKTRSGKIMRRLLVDLAEGRTLGDTTSLQDSTVPTRIAEVLAG